MIFRYQDNFKEIILQCQFARWHTSHWEWWEWTTDCQCSTISTNFRPMRMRSSDSLNHRVAIVVIWTLALLLMVQYEPRREGKKLCEKGLNIWVLKLEESNSYTWAFNSQVISVLNREALETN